MMPRKAVILARGSAIFEGILVSDRPKVLLPIANIPLIEYMKSALKSAGVERIILLLDKSSAAAAQHFSGNFKYSSNSVEWVIQDEPRGTGGSLKEIESRLRGESFWVVNGNLFLGSDLRDAVAFHRERGAIVTIGATRINETSWYKERIQMEGDQRVKAIHRIHPLEEHRSMIRPVGFYLCEPAILDLIPDRGYFDLKEQLFSMLYDKGKPVFAWEIQDYCRAIYSLGDYLEINRDVLLKRVQFPHLSPSPDVIREPFPNISLSATLLEPVAIGSTARVSDGAMIIGPSSIGDSCEIHDNAVINECVVFEGAKIGRNARLNRCIVGAESVVESGSSMSEMILAMHPKAKGELVKEKLSHSRIFGWQETLEGLSKARKIYLHIRRAFDVVVSMMVLALTAPLIIVISIAIKIDSRGKVFFRQIRCGQHGREFIMYKFRSMVKNAEEMKKDIKRLNEVDGPMFKIINDPRTTRMGQFLRATNLDELPQFWNVLRGDISLIGPRPLSIDEMRLNPRWRDMRLMVPQGITGLWQIKAHSKVSFNEWIQEDIDYVINLSPWLDMKILFSTVLNTVRNFARLFKRG